MYDEERDYILERYEILADKTLLEKLAEAEYNKFLQEMDEAQQDDYRRNGRF